MSFSSANISDTQFHNSNSQKGGVLFVESLQNETIRIQDSYIANINIESMDPNLIDATSGSLIVRNTSFYNVNSSLFNTKAVLVDIDSMYADSISCYSVGTFCILQGSQTDLNFSNSQLTGVKSGGDLVSLSTSTGYIKISNVSFSDITTLNKNSQYFVYRMTSAKNVVIENSVFSNLYGFSCVNLMKVHFHLRNNTFTNSISSNSKQRILRVADSLDTLATQFISLHSSFGSITNSSFEMNALNNLLDRNGGVNQFTLIDLTHLGSSYPRRWRRIRDNRLYIYKQSSQTRRSYWCRWKSSKSANQLIEVC